MKRNLTPRFRTLCSAALVAVVGLGGAGTMLVAPTAVEAKDCPPGLAKKHNGCQPPGQAKKNDYRADFDGKSKTVIKREDGSKVVIKRDGDDKTVRIENEDDRRDVILKSEDGGRYYRVDRGDRIDRYDYRYIDRSDYDRYNLRRLEDDRYRYAVVGNQIVEVDSTTMQVLNLIRALN